MPKPKKIVCLGGGNAMPKAVLAGLKKYPVKLSVICAMLDSGGSAGRLRKDYKIVSPGDIRRSFIALANTSPAIEELFNYRFQVGELKGHNFANLLITALELSTDNYEEVMEEMKKFLKIKHQVLPVTLDKSNLYAVLENGKVISGETNIDVPKHNGKLKIKKVFLKPKTRAYPKALVAIQEADFIVIGPGD
ncbi:Gluconeogenesis factor [subsurface metagenome]